MTARENAFLNDLRQLTVSTGKNNREVTKTVDDYTCVAIANFFHEAMDAPAIVHLRLLIRYCMRVDKESGLDRGAAAGAAALV